jgi:hypothetical protein
MSEISPVVAPTPIPAARRFFPVAGVAIVALVLFQAGPRLLDPQLLGLEDFIQYWSAGKLLATGGNPYAPDQIDALQRAEGWTKDEPLQMWNPPPVLTLTLPWSWFSFPVSRALCLLVQLLVILGCADWLWRFYGGSAQKRWLAWVIAFTLFPSLVVLRLGQISLLILLAFVGFLHFEKKGRYVLAGGCLALAAVKPHLVVLVGVAALLWAVHGRRWAVLAGGLLVGAVATAIPLLFDPVVFSQYLHALKYDKPPSNHLTPTAATLLRLAFGEEHAWVQYLPLFAGLVWLIPYWYRRRDAWDWAEQLPLLAPVSVLVTFYGAWPLDLIVLLVPVVQTAAWHVERRTWRWDWIAVYAACNAVALGMNVARCEEFTYFWFGPTLLALYLLLRSRASRPEAGAGIASAI